MLKTVASLYYALRNARVEPVGSARIENGRLVIEVPGLSSATWPGFFWFRGRRFYDPDYDTEYVGTEITDSGESGTAEWIEIDMGSMTATYKENGPEGPTWGHNKIWRRISDLGNGKHYIQC